MKARFPLSAAPAILLAALFAAAPAYAGFTLITPDNTGTTVPAVPAVPVQTAPIAMQAQQQPQMIQQQVIQNNNTVTRTRVGPATVELSPIAPPAVPMVAPMLTGPQTQVIAAAPVMAPVAAAEPIVHGFGKDIPLVIAAQQIAPADRQIAFGQGVDPSVPVTWKGGRPWHNVLSEALNRRGLQMTEQGNIVIISQSQSLATSKASLLMQPQSNLQSNDTASQTTTTTTMVPVPMQMPAPAPIAAAPPAMPMATQAMPMQPMATPMQQNANVVMLPPMGMAPTPVVNTMPPAPMMQPPMAQNAAVTTTSVTTMPAPMMQNTAQSTAMSAPVIPPAAMVPPPVAAPMTPVANTQITPAIQQFNPVMPPARTVAVTTSTTTMTPMMTTPIAPVAKLPDIAQPMPISAAVGTPKSVSDVAPAPGDNTAWHASVGRTLKQTLEDWSHQANVTLRWDSEYDYPIQSNITVTGDYEAAVRGLLRGFSSAQPQPVARLYRPSPGMPGVLLVTGRGNDMSMMQ